MDLIFGGLFLSFVAAYLSAAVIMAFWLPDLSTEWGWVIIILLTVFYFFLLVRWNGKKTACPQCKKLYAMKEIQRNILYSQDTTMDVQREIRDTKGQVIGTYTEAVQGTKDTCICTDRCRFCGYTQNVVRKSTHR